MSAFKEPILNFRCCDEEDVPEIWALVKTCGEELPLEEVGTRTSNVDVAIITPGFPKD
jgi:hypothetical protein